MNKSLGALLGLFFISFTMFITFFFFRTPLAKFTRAKEDYLPSISRSLIIRDTMIIKADGVSQSTLTIFVRSEKDIPVKGQKVHVFANTGKFKENDLETDDLGKVTVHYTSTVPGEDEIKVQIGDKMMEQKLSIKAN